MSILWAMPNWSSPSELWMQRLLDGVADEVSCIACRRPGVRRWRDRVPVIDVSRRAIGHRWLERAGLPAPWPGLRAMLRAGRSPQIRCVLSHYAAWSVQLDSVWRRLDKPLFIHCHGYDVTWELRKHTPPFAPVHDAYYPARLRELAERATFIANSRRTASRLREIGVPVDRIAVNYLGVPVPVQCPPRPAERRPMKILYLGRLVDFKGPDLTIRAFDIACSRGLDGELLIAGDGPLQAVCELLRRRSRHADRIKMLGAVDADRGRSLRREADLFTAHSCTGPITGQEEAFGVAFVEAMAEGLPVVTGRSGSLGEVLDEGRCGVLFKPGDVDAHARALLELAADPRRRDHLGRVGRQRAASHFSPDQCRDGLRRILGLTESAPAALPRAA